MPEFTPAEKAYIDYLDEIYDAPDYGFLMYKGDQIRFEVGLKEWLSNLTEEEKYELGIEEPPRRKYEEIL